MRPLSCDTDSQAQDKCRGGGMHLSVESPSQKHRGRHYWLNPRGANAKSPLIGWRAADGAARYPAVALKSRQQKREFPAAGESQLRRSRKSYV